MVLNLAFSNLHRGWLAGVLGVALTLAACGGGDAGVAPQSPVTSPSGKAWQAAGQVIDGLGTSVNGAQVAINADGVGFAVWVQIDEGGRLNVFASRYGAGKWSAAQSISGNTDALGGVEGVQVALHPNGDATVLWTMLASSSNKADIVVNRYVAGQWAGPNVLVSQSGRAAGPQIASSANGSAIVVWQQKETANESDVWAAFFDGVQFGLPRQLNSGNGDATGPQIAINSKGEAVAVWKNQLSSGATSIVTRSFTGSNWNFFTENLSDNGADVDGPQIALGDDGQAVAVWLQKTGEVLSLLASRRDTANKWLDPQLVETNDAGNAAAPQITMDTLGNATVVWEQLAGLLLSSRRDVWANRLVDGNWLGAQKLETDDAGDARAAQVGSDSSGNAIAVWDQFDGTRLNIFSARFDGTQWGAPELIEQDNASNATFAQIAVNPAGRALAVWQQRTGAPGDPASTDDIVVNVFK
jgi:hypothetical protein